MTAPLSRRPIALLAALACLPAAAQLPPQPADLPMRNLQIEVRQVQAGSQSGTSVQGAGGVVLAPGQSRGQFGFSGGAGSQQTSRSSTQMALVLNGRETRIALGNTVPVRIVQSFVQGGQVRVLPGTVLVEANTGFAARPVWRGGDTVEVEIGTALAATRSAQGAAASATVAAPVGEWFTIAQSDDAMAAQSSGTLGYGQQGGASRLEVQMRVSVR